MSMPTYLGMPPFPEAAKAALADSQVVVESEGNGRMCVTLPETLISVVGVEKILPSCRDLEVLVVLPAQSGYGRFRPTLRCGRTCTGNYFGLFLLECS